ncbi:transporter substrate-binding domain-containing protein [Paraburkholderia mimosarum]|uniref:transporter substrate-binding domain-containing protein n=1 Tax=Paraburkholderia mimosarum TaxID=312026 RepID=UPI0004870529|nr:transporter substrate-binding domain-containing protein [Paraburkholderia mimosarum]
MRMQARRKWLGFVLAAAGVVAGAAVAHAQSGGDESIRGGEITVGIHNRAPWGYRNADGSVAGVGPDMIRAVLGQAGVKKINFVVVDFDALIPSLLSRRIDAVASGLAITPPGSVAPRCRVKICVRS